jgi:hypothetical protein
MGLFTKKIQKEEIKKPFTVTPRVSEISEPSDLPKLPELPSLDDDEYQDEAIPKLPSFPTNTLGTKFSQNTIKEAVSGKKEVAGVFDANDFSEEEDSEIMHKPLKKSTREEFENYNESEELQRPTRSITREESAGYEKPTRSITREEPAEYEKSIVPRIREEPREYEESSFTPKSREISGSRGYKGNYATKKAEPVFVRLDKFEESMNLFDDIKAQIADMEHLIRNTKEIKQKEEEELNSWQNQLQEVKRQIEKVDKDIFSKID